jgi:hypothetical protein
MKIALKIVLLIGSLCTVSLVLAADDLPKNIIAFEECLIGVMVKKIDSAIQKPEKPESLQTVIMYGTDSRYYVMIRGWLEQELAGVRSQILTSHIEIESSILTQKEIFLTKSIRLIDLE